MKCIGLIGGTSWHSTIEYYRIINQLTNRSLGDKVNPPIILSNLNQSQIHLWQQENRWNEIEQLYTRTSMDLERIGAEAIAFCANTPHKIATTVQQYLTIPILHIADATVDALREIDLQTVGLLGTKFTMTESFFINKIQQAKINVLVPQKEGIELLHNLVTNDLAKGKFDKNSKRILIDEMTALHQQGAKGIILGCTEFPLLIQKNDYHLPLFDTTQLHCEYIVKFILNA